MTEFVSKPFDENTSACMGNPQGTWNLDLCDEREKNGLLGLRPKAATPLSGDRFIADRVNLWSSILREPSLTTFADIVREAGLEGNLQQDVRFTVLAPTNTAFDRLTASSAQALDDARAAAVAGTPRALQDWVVAHILGGGNRFLVDPIGTSAALCRAQLGTTVLSTELFGQLPPGSFPVILPDLSFTLVALESKCPMSSTLNSAGDLNAPVDPAAPTPADQEKNFVQENILATNGILHTIDGVLTIPNTTAQPNNMFNPYTGLPIDNTSA